MKEVERADVRRRLSCLVVIAVLMAAVACGSDAGTGPGSGASPKLPRLTVVSGGAQTDTIDATLSQPLVVELRDGSGAVVSGTSIQFEGLATTDPLRPGNAALVSATNDTLFSGSLTSATDASGRASVRVKLGQVAGPTGIHVRVASLSLDDTIALSVIPGAIRGTAGTATPDTAVKANSIFTLATTPIDRHGNRVPATTIVADKPGLTSLGNGQFKAGSAFARVTLTMTWPTGTQTHLVSVLEAQPLVGVNTPLKAVGMINTDGTGLVTFPSTGDLPGWPHSVRATPKVVFQTKTLDDSGTVWIVAPSGLPTQLVSAKNGIAGASWPRFSPDAQWVYFVGVRVAFSTRVLFRVHPDGTGPDSIAALDWVPPTENVLLPAVTPDGRSVAIDDTAGLKVIDVATKRPRTLGVHCAYPHYSADGTQLSCFNANGGQQVMSADGTGIKHITASLLYAGSADWPSAGNWIGVEFQFAGLFGGAVDMDNVDDGSEIFLPSVGGLIQVAFVR